MKVYILTHGEYSDRYNEAVFSTREVAEDYLIATARNAHEAARKRTEGLHEQYAGQAYVTLPPLLGPFVEPERPLAEEWLWKVANADIEEHTLWRKLPVNLTKVGS